MATITLPTSIQPRSPQGGFVNESFTNFKDPEVVRDMRGALTLVEAQLGREYDLVIGGHRRRTEGKIRSINPARPAQIVGIHQQAGSGHAEDAVQAALAAFESWSRTSVQTRASLLLNAAEVLRRRKLEFDAWLVYEVGKNW
ncbi:MAG TPA: aldehyde dehydrogenase family protein, partial [Terracidiphilus sp.]|nr:aldehyde dehydrogenase family protein [Terracidiphilus sp.]